jgi:hypothetical protein
VGVVLLSAPSRREPRRSRHPGFGHDRRVLGPAAPLSKLEKVLPGNFRVITDPGQPFKISFATQDGKERKVLAPVG